MRNFTPDTIALVCGGILRCAEDIRKTEVRAVTIDSRTVQKGDLFAAFEGERVDGHDYIQKAIDSGALLVLCEKEEKAEGLPHVLVPSVKQALCDLARFYLAQFDLPVVAITGSVGKTSTKEMIAGILSRRFRVLKTEGNFNNEIGLPLTIFRLSEEDEIAVLEMGISHFGDMTVLADIAPMDVAVITNIGTAHLEYLGDRDGIFRAKTEMFAFLKEGGIAILNGDDDKLGRVEAVGASAPVFYGFSKDNDYYATDLQSFGFEGTSAVFHTPEGSFPVRIPVPGDYMVGNALAGAAVANFFGLSGEQIREGIEAFETLDGRFKVFKKEGVTVIDDAYNANPASMMASLKILSEGEGRRVAVLGDMGELGEQSEMLHREVGEYLARLSIDELVTAGPSCCFLADAAKADPDLAVTSYPDTATLKEHLQDHIRPGDTVLFKASHFMAFSDLL